MSLSVEDGTGLSTAESYVSVAECDTYATNNGLTAWTGTAAVKEVALRKATRYLDTAFRWRGVRSTTTQALEWPRWELAWTDPAITRMKAACCELAVKSLAADLFADVDAQHVTSVTVGPISRSLSAPANGGQKRYAAVDALVNDLTIGRGNIAVSRA